MNFIELAIIACITALAYGISLWFARTFRYRIEKDSTAADEKISGWVRRQANYFATTNAIGIFILLMPVYLLVRLFSDRIISAVLHGQITQAIANDTGTEVSGTVVAALVDKARNRMAFPDLYDDQGAGVVVQNAINWYGGAQNLVDLLLWAVIVLLAIIALSWRLYRYGSDASSPQQLFERLSRSLLMSASGIAILCSVGIVASLLTESFLFFTNISLFDFLFGLHWNPQIAIREDQVAAAGAFGFIPLLTGTLLISVIAIMVAFPVGTMIAIYTSEYASARRRNLIKPTLEILVGIPTVVYGAFAAIYFGPWLRDVFSALGVSVTIESALAVGIIMGIMIIPLVSSLIDDALHQVPNSIREAMFALGATRLELVKMILLPSCLPGIVGALLLAVSRAFGETMIVVMAAGLLANLTINPLEAVTTVTVQIATILVGDQSFDSLKTLSAYALGLTLFLITLSLNVLASWVSNRFKVAYQ